MASIFKLFESLHTEPDTLNTAVYFFLSFIIFHPSPYLLSPKLQKKPGSRRLGKVSEVFGVKEFEGSGFAGPTATLVWCMDRWSRLGCRSRCRRSLQWTASHLKEAGGGGLWSPKLRGLRFTPERRGFTFNHEANSTVRRLI